MALLHHFFFFHDLVVASQHYLDVCSHGRLHFTEDSFARPNIVFVLPAWCSLVFGQCDHFAHQPTDMLLCVCTCVGGLNFGLPLSEWPNVQARGLFAREHCAAVF